MESYVIGDKYVPYWCRNRIMQYKKMDGTTGYEFHHEMGRILQMNKGDVLYRGQDKSVKRKG